MQHRPLSRKQAEKVNRNFDILQSAIDQGDRRPRNLFYLANELKDHGRFAEAISVYEEYLTVSDLRWEKYWAILCLIRCFRQLGDSENARRYATEAIYLDSQRAEGYIQLGLYCYERGQWDQAIPYFKTASQLQQPTQGFTEKEAYSWLPHDFLSICHANLGQHLPAIQASLNALPHHPHKERLRKNLHWMVDQL